MQVGRYLNDEGPALAIVVEDQWVNLTRVFADFARDGDTPPSIILDSIEKLLAMDGCNRAFYHRIRDYCATSGRLAAYYLDYGPEWLAPLSPGKVVAVGRNYKAHAEELGNAVPEDPILFVKTPNTILAPEKAIRIDPAWGRVDHEGELAVLIGRRASRIASGDAHHHVAGYLLLNDVTARDMQSVAKNKGLPWFVAKNMDTFCPLGPVLTTADEIAWPPALDIEVSVNGGTRQRGNTSQFIFPLDELIAHISRYMTLEPGDVIATGTPAGVGPLHPGDTVVVSCPELGQLFNTVEAMEA